MSVSSKTTPGTARRGRRVVWVAGVAAAVAVAAAGCSSAPAPSAAPPAPKHGKHAAKGVAGTVQAENGTTWTVATKDNKQVTVNLAPTTTFGTKTAPASAAQFPVGSQVRVRGAVTGTTVAAKQVSAPKKAAPAPS